MQQLLQLRCITVATAVADAHGISCYGEERRVMDTGIASCSLLCLQGRVTVASACYLDVRGQTIAIADADASATAVAGASTLQIHAVAMVLD